jgi:hypothetical protein
MAFAVLTVLAVPAFPKARSWQILLGLGAFGALIELVQAIPALHRDCDLADWLADVASILCMLVAMRMLAFLYRASARGGE